MKAILPRLVLGLAATVVAAAPLLARDERVSVAEGVTVAVAVPQGWTWESARAADGPATARLTGEEGKVVLQLTFLPDPAGRMAEADLQLQLMDDLVEPFVADFVEQGARLEPLLRGRGIGLYAVFTDRKLVGQAELPPNEFRHATTGVRTGTGWFVAFTLFSQELAAPGHRAALNIVRLGLRDASAVSGRPRRDPQAF
jgi:hypothetical protein